MTVGVSVAIIVEHGRVLLCQRSATSRYSLKWEFPGGKIEKNEEPIQALKRECFEELGIIVNDAILLQTSTSQYDDGGTFSVHFYAVVQFSGIIENKVFNAYEWVSPNELLEFDLLSGNVDFCKQLPKILVEKNIL